MADEEYNTDNLNYDEEVPDLLGGGEDEANGGAGEAAGAGAEEAMEEVISAKSKDILFDFLKLKVRYLFLQKWAMFGGTWVP